MNTPSIILKTLIGLLVSTGLMFLNNLGWLDWLQSGVGFITRPQVQLLTAASRQVTSAVDTIRFIKSGPAQIADLERRLIAAENLNSAAHQAHQENAQLKKVLGVTALSNHRLQPATVLASGQQMTVENVGLAPGQVVISAEGALIGTVMEAGVWSARVQRLTDAGSIAAARVLSAAGGSLATGAVIGEFGTSLSLTKILTEIELEPTLAVVTSGEDDNIPPNLLIGWVSSQITRIRSDVYQQALIEPAAAVKSGDTVFVIKK